MNTLILLLAITMAPPKYSIGAQLIYQPAADLEPIPVQVYDINICPQSAGKRRYWCYDVTYKWYPILSNPYFEIRKFTSNEVHLK